MILSAVIFTPRRSHFIHLLSASQRGAHSHLRQDLISFFVVIFKYCSLNLWAVFNSPPAPRRDGAAGADVQAGETDARRENVFDALAETRRGIKTLRVNEIMRRFITCRLFWLTVAFIAILLYCFALRIAPFRLFLRRCDRLRRIPSRRMQATDDSGCRKWCLNLFYYFFLF